MVQHKCVVATLMVLLAVVYAAAAFEATAVDVTYTEQGVVRDRRAGASISVVRASVEETMKMNRETPLDWRVSFVLLLPPLSSLFLTLLFASLRVTACR